MTSEVERNLKQRRCSTIPTMLFLALTAAPFAVLRAQTSQQVAWTLTARVPEITRVRRVSAFSESPSDSGFISFNGSVDLVGNAAMTLQARLVSPHDGPTEVHTSSGWRPLTDAWTGIASTENGAVRVSVAFRVPHQMHVQEPLVVWRVIQSKE